MTARSNDENEEGIMKCFTLIKGALAMAVVALLLAPVGAAHNRAHITLPSGECFLVGSLKSVVVPAGTRNAVLQPDGVTWYLDLRPGTYPADEIGTAFAADEGNSRLVKGNVNEEGKICT